jgi:hypothetical protein
MIRLTRGLPAVLSVFLLLPAGCKRKDPAQGGPGGGTSTGGTAQGKGEAQLLPIGMADPFPRVSGPAAKAMDRGYKALRAKKPDEAAVAFAEVVAALPDHTGMRYELARALLLSGKLTEARQQLEELLARDYLAYAGRADKPKEWKPLRDSPEWAALKAAEARYKAAYAKGLDKGFVFVARGKAAKTPSPAVGSDARQELNQEVYHYDPATSRYRRLTWTRGQVFAAMRSPDGKTLSFLTVDKLRKGERGDLFVEPQGGFVDLVTLETVGPFKLAGTFHEVSMGFGAGGVPVWSTESTPGVDGGAFTVDTARTGMAKGSVVIESARTWAQAAQVWHSGKGSPQGVTMAADQRSFTMENGGQVTSARALSNASLEWSPGRKRITYAGRLDACEVLAQGDKAPKNELFVYDVEKKSAQRIDSGLSEFEALWLDDNLLVYENGVGAKGTVNLYDLAGHKKTQLAPRHGAGLYGVPSLTCEKPEPAADEPEAVSDPAAAEE